MASTLASMDAKRRLDALRILVLGGGVAALEAMLTLRRLVAGRAAIRLIAPQREFVYRSLAIAEPFGLGRVHRFDLPSLARGAGVELVPARVVAVAPEERTVMTDDGRSLDYDILVVASGARRRVALPGTITLWGVADGTVIGPLLADLERGAARRVVFAVHADAAWPVPLYELALLTAAHLGDTDSRRRTVLVVTHEASALEMLGRDASRGVRGLLEARGIEHLASRNPTAFRDGLLRTERGAVRADRVVTMPRLEGPAVEGLPTDDRGFIHVDRLGRVPGAPDVYAAGDATTLPISSGGLAGEHAHAVARTVAAATGASVETRPFRPILRGTVLTARRQAGGRPADDSSVAIAEMLWWPRDGIGGRHLTTHLAGIAGSSLTPPEPADGGATVEVELPAAA